jgi:hypothetical protein
MQLKTSMGCSTSHKYLSEQALVNKICFIVIIITTNSGAHRRLQLVYFRDWQSWTYKCDFNLLSYEILQMCVLCTRNYVHSKRLGSPNEYPFFCITVADTWTRQSRNRGSTLGRGNNFFVLKIVLIHNVAHLASYSTGSDSPFPTGQSAAAWS